MVQNKIKRISEEEYMKKWKEDNDPHIQLGMACKKIAALESILRQIINDLPTKRDWLDPELEKAARDILKGVK